MEVNYNVIIAHPIFLQNLEILKCMLMGLVHAVLGCE